MLYHPDTMNEAICCPITQLRLYRPPQTTKTFNHPPYPQAQSPNVTAGKQKCRGFLEILTIFDRGLGGSGNFASQVLILTPKTAPRKDVIPSVIRHPCLPMEQRPTATQHNATIRPVGVVRIAVDSKIDQQSVVERQLLHRSRAHTRDVLLYVRVGLGHRDEQLTKSCLLYTSPSPRDGLLSRMPSSA